MLIFVTVFTFLRKESILINRNARLSLLLASIATLSACGGGSDSDTTPGTTVFTQSNYLDATWVAGVGLQRLINTAYVADSLFSLATTTNPDTAVACSMGGNIKYSGTSALLTFEPTNCSWGSSAYNMILKSGTVQMANPKLATCGSSYILESSAITLGAVAEFRSSDTVADRPGDESYAGALAQSATCSPSAGKVQGSYDVTRNSKVTKYRNIVYNYTNAGLTNVSVSIESPAFAASTLVTVASGTTTTLTAADNSKLVITNTQPSASDPVYSYDAYDSKGLKTFSLSSKGSSAESLAAKARVLQ